MGAVRFGIYLTQIDPAKAEFYGDGYISDIIISDIKRDNERKLYQYYVTDALHAIVENTSHSGGVTMTARYRDLAEPEEEEQQPEMSPEEIKAKILGEFKRLGGGG